MTKNAIIKHFDDLFFMCTASGLLSAVYYRLEALRLTANTVELNPKVSLSFKY